MQKAFKQLRLKPGDVYESCDYHPVLCLGVDYKADMIWGISLIDGTHPRMCSLLHCGVRKLSLKQAWKTKMNGPEDAGTGESISLAKPWWNANANQQTRKVGMVGPRKAKQPAVRAKKAKD